jgi:hypothetical protein
MSKTVVAAAPEGPEKNRMVQREMVRVRAVGHMHEDGHREPGSTWQTTEKRAKALGPLITIVKE